jgi:pimeloyl-ACP methyl ester carboxylesterase
MDARKARKRSGNDGSDPRAHEARILLTSRAMLVKDVAARGARIRFIEAGAGTPLLLVHDFAASREVWTATAMRLASKFHVVAPDLPGFGASEKPDPQRYAYGYDAFSESLFDLVAALGLGRVHVCGHGMGAGVALTLAAGHPSLVNKLVLVDALVYPAGDHALERAGRVPLVGGLLWKQLMGPALFRTYLQGTVYGGAARVPPGRFDALFEAFNAPAARQAAHATLVAKADTRTLVARLPRVTADALVIWGRDDRLAPVEHGRRLARELRGRFEVFECGRCPPDEEPDGFSTTLAAFLERKSVPDADPKSGRSSRPSIDSPRSARSSRPSFPSR